MSKRALSSNFSPDKNKRAKIQRTNQPRIDSFFGSPAKAKASPTAIADDAVRHSSTDANKASKSSSAILEIIDVDALESEEEKQLQPNKDIKKEASTRVLGEANARLSEADFLPLDIDPTHYDPASQPSNSPHAPYSLLTHALVALSQTRSRIAIINILTNLMQTIISKHPSSLLPAVYLLSNSLGPQFIPIELGLGSSIISHSIQQISGLSSATLKRMYNNTGDPGDVAFQAKSNIRTLVPHAPLTVPYVYQSLLRISRCKGSGAGKEKQKVVEKLLLAANGEEVRYLTRTLYQNLRVGAVRTSILTALARAFALTPSPTRVKDPSTPNDMTASNPENPAADSSSRRTPGSPSKRKQPVNGRERLFKEAESLIKSVYVKHPSYDQIIPALLECGLKSLAEHVPLVVGKNNTHTR
jgi:DNA ligase-1